MNEKMNVQSTPSAAVRRPGSAMGSSARSMHLRERKLEERFWGTSDSGGFPEEIHKGWQHSSDVATPMGTSPSVEEQIRGLEETLRALRRKDRSLAAELKARTEQHREQKRRLLALLDALGETGLAEVTQFDIDEAVLCSSLEEEADADVAAAFLRV